MKIYNARCFGIDSNSGNEAIIIQDSNLSIEERLLFAQNQNKSACVFIEHTDDNAVIKLDYYYPHKRSPLCLHGTLAAVHISFSNHPSVSQLTVITSMTNQKIIAEKVDDNIFLTVEQQEVDQAQVKLDTTTISKLLNLDLSVDYIEYYIASSGSPKLFIELADLHQLYFLRPNLELIHQWSKRNKINGLYVYCKLSDNSYSGRNFNHINPALEDAATGVAASAMTNHLKKDLVVYQGLVTGNKCVIYTKFLDNNVQIGGRINLNI